MSQKQVYLKRGAERNAHWKVYEIDKVEQREWQQAIGHATLEEYTNEEVKRNNWKWAAIDYGEDDAFIHFAS